MFDRILGWMTRTTVSVVVVLAALALGTLFTLVGSFALGAGVASDLAAAVVVVVTLAELGFVGVALVFLALVDDGPEYVGMRPPDRDDLRYAVVGTLATYAVATAGMAAVWSTGATGRGLPTEELTGQNVEGALLALVVVSILVIGPSEELLFRGVVQRYLYGAFSGVGAISVASVLFALVHAPTFFLTGSVVAAFAGATVIFAISLILGYLYARTENLVVPAVVHGVYDATLFGATYLALQFGLL